MKLLRKDKSSGNAGQCPGDYPAYRLFQSGEALN